MYCDYREEIEQLLCNGAGISTSETQVFTWMHPDPCMPSALNKEIIEQLQSLCHDKGMSTRVSDSSKTKVWVILLGKQPRPEELLVKNERSLKCMLEERVKYKLWL